MKSPRFIFCATLLSLASLAVNGFATVTPPAISVRYPAPGARVLNSPINVTGVAADRSGIDHIEIFTAGDSIFSGKSLVVDGTTNWSSEPINLIPGTNTIWVRAIDTSGNASKLVQRTFFYVVKSPLTLNTNGTGRIAGLRDQETLDIGRAYRVTAVPGRGQVFVNWTDGTTGAILSTNASLRFLMQDSLGLTANFTTNLFVRLKGNYSGLFSDPNALAPYSAGYITLDLMAQSVFSGKLKIGSIFYPFTGQFSDNQDGTAASTISVPRGTNSALSVNLVLGTDPLSSTLSGTIYGEEIGSDGWPIDWSVPISGQLSKLPAHRPVTGRYNVVVPSLALDDSAPGGCGYGNVTLTSTGTVTLSLTLPDSSATLSFSSPIGRDGTFPFYAPLYSGKGFILGWLAFTNQTSSDLIDSNVYWYKPAGTSKVYGSGFATQTTMFGARYLAPAKGKNVLRWTRGAITLGGGNLDSPIQLGVTFDPLVNQFIIDGDTNRVTLNPATGSLSGKVVLDPALPARSFSGTIATKTGNVLGPLPSGFGFFLGQTQSGYVYIGPQ